MKTATAPSGFLSARTDPSDQVISGSLIVLQFLDQPKTGLTIPAVQGDFRARINGALSGQAMKATADYYPVAIFSGIPADFKDIAGHIAAMIRAIPLAKIADSGAVHIPIAGLADKTVISAVIATIDFFAALSGIGHFVTPGIGPSRIGIGFARIWDVSAMANSEPAFHRGQL